jgi:hypothetical protein
MIELPDQLAVMLLEQVHDGRPFFEVLRVPVQETRRALAML